jgi:hypothetical protein
MRLISNQAYRNGGHRLDDVAYRPIERPLSLSAAARASSPNPSLLYAAHIVHCIQNSNQQAKTAGRGHRFDDCLKFIFLNIINILYKRRGMLPPSRGSQSPRMPFGPTI